MLSSWQLGLGTRVISSRAYLSVYKFQYDPGTSTFSFQESEFLYVLSSLFRRGSRTRPKNHSCTTRHQSAATLKLQPHHILQAQQNNLPNKDPTMTEHKLKTSIAILGCGDVGSTLAYTLILNPICSEVILVDPKTALLEAQVRDLNDATYRGGSGTKVRAGTHKDAGQADIVVITAGAKQKPGTLFLYRRPTLQQLNARSFPFLKFFLLFFSRLFCAQDYYRPCLTISRRIPPLSSLQESTHPLFHFQLDVSNQSTHDPHPRRKSC